MSCNHSTSLQILQSTSCKTDTSHGESRVDVVMFWCSGCSEHVNLNLTLKLVYFLMDKGKGFKKVKNTWTLKDADEAIKCYSCEGSFEMIFIGQKIVVQRQK